MRTLEFLKRFFLIGFLAAGLSACPQSMVQPDPNDPLQQAYQVKDSLILAKRALNDLYEQEMNRRRVNPDGKPFITDYIYDTAWKTSQDATVIINHMIAKAQLGTLDKTLQADAQKKIDEIAKVNGGVK